MRGRFTAGGRRKPLPLLTALLVLTLLAAACTGGGEGNGESDEGDGGGGAGGDATFVYAVAGVPDTLDITQTFQGDATRRLMYEVGSGLVRYAPGPDSCETLPTIEDIEGDLAESWEYDADDNLLMTLRGGVTSAEGNELTAEDVRWSLSRAQEMSPIVSFLMSSIADYTEENTFEVVDDQTIKINTDSRTALDAAVLTWGQMVIYDTAAIAAEVGDLTDQDAVSEYLTGAVPSFGPWQLDGFTPGTEATFTENENYWETEERGNVNRLVLRNIDEASTRLQLVQTGEADLAGQLSFEQYASLRDEGDGGSQLLACTSADRDMVMLNTQQEPFDDEDVRKGISMAIDRETLSDAVYKGFATPTTSGLSQEAYSFPDPANQFTFDPEQAKDLLPDGVSITLRASPTRPGAHSEGIAIQLQNMLSEVGVNVEIDLVPGAAEFSDAFFSGEYETILYNEPPAIADPFFSVSLYNATESFQNTHGYTNKEYDDLALGMQRTEPGPERDALLQEISEVIVETTPVVYLVERQFVYAWGQNVNLDSYQHAPHGEPRVVNLEKVTD